MKNPPPIVRNSAVLKAHVLHTADLGSNSGAISGEPDI